VDPNHIRKKPFHTDRLKSTIADVGLLQPILIRKSNDAYIVVDGARRLQALKELDIHELIVGRDVIEDVEETEADTRFKQIIANIQRDDINVIELGHAFVKLKELYGYNYKETADIIGKTAHYVTSKAGLVTRLIPELQEQAAKDWSETKCIQDTFLDDLETDKPYEMSVKVLEDIARLPPEVQRPAYDTIRSREMGQEEALRFLGSVKRNSDVLKLVNDSQGLTETYPDGSKIDPVEVQQKEIHNHLKKLNDDIDALASRIKAEDMGQQEQVARELESLMAKLNAIYDTIIGEISTGRPVAGKVCLSDMLGNPG
jgi:ParB family chromosome partitioning protein